MCQWHGANFIVLSVPTTTPTSYLIDPPEAPAIAWLHWSCDLDQATVIIWARQGTNDTSSYVWFRRKNAMERIPDDNDRFTCSDATAFSEGCKGC